MSDQCSMPLHKGIDECSIDELYCAMDDLGLDMDGILALSLTLLQVREIYRGVLRWQLNKVTVECKNLCHQNVHQFVSPLIDVY